MEIIPKEKHGSYIIHSDKIYEILKKIYRYGGFMKKVWLIILIIVLVLFIAGNILFFNALGNDKND